MRLFLLPWNGARRLAASGSSLFRGYFFGPGDFALSAAICRIAVGVCLGHLLGQISPPDWSAYLAGFDQARYKPVGILGLLGRDVPPADFFRACHAVTTVAIVGMVLGCFTRTCFMIGTLGMLFLTALPWSFNHGWGHHQNVILLAALALMGTGSSPLSLDALWARWRGTEVPDHHRWGVVLGQLAVALMFTNACFWKLYQPGKPFGVWALSDNMYHTLLHHYWYLDRPLPPHLDWVIERDWAFKLLAVGNLITQFVPVLACFLLRSPRLRALAGAAMLLETFAIGAVMQLNNPIWYLLFAFFVDWDRLAAWLRLKTPTVSLGAGFEGPRWRYRLTMVWIVVFLACYLTTAFTKKTQTLFTFPFTAWGMYSDVAAQPPYDQHLPYTIQGSTWVMDANPPVTLDYRRTLWVTQGNLPWHAKWETRQAVLARVQRETGSTRILLSKTSFQSLPYPAKEIRPSQSAYSCVLENGVYKGLEATHGWDASRGKYFVALAPHGFAQPRMRLGYHRNHVEPWQPLPVEQVGSRYYYDKPAQDKYWLAVLVQDTGDSTERSFDAGVFRK